MAALIFDFAPAGDAPRIERLEYRTALSISRNGTEQRIPTRELPRFSLSATYILDSLSPAALSRLRSGGTALLPLHHARLGTSPAPLVEVQLLGDYPASSRTHKLHTITLQFEATQPLPSALASLGPTPSPSPAGAGSPPSSAPASSSLVVAPSFLVHNYSVALKELLATDRSGFDEGFVREQSVRYLKRGHQLEVALKSRAEIDEFRAFFCALKGAAGEFAWTAPGDDRARRWRLAGDAVSINHITAEYATVSIAAVYLGELL